MAQKKVSRNKEKTGNKGWALALEQAELALYKNRARKSNIMQAIRFFQEQIKNGTPWPLKPKLSQKR
jgi:hypothetical protein